MNTKRTYVVLGKNRFIRNEMYLDDAHNRVEYELDGSERSRKQNDPKQSLVVISFFVGILIWFTLV